MTNTKGYRRGTRYMFSRAFKQKGRTPLSQFMIVYKRGDIVDIKVGGCNSWQIFDCLKKKLAFIFQTILTVLFQVKPSVAYDLQ